MVDWSGVRVLITGGSGFIGTNAIEYFASHGSDVLNVDVRPPRNSAHRSVWRETDILDYVSLCRVVRGFDPHFLIHLAGRTDLLEKRDIRGYAANYDGTRNVIDACAACHELKRVIFASSRMVCKIGYMPRGETDYCPPNPYGESKVRAEHVVRESQAPFDWLIVRPTSIWGPWFDVPYKLFFTAIANRTYLHPRGYDPEKSFGFVGNSVYQCAQLLLAPSELVRGVTIYQCDYPPLRLRQWADLITRAMGLAPIRTAPLPVLRGIARAGDVLAKLGWARVPLTTFRLDNILTPMVFDTTVLAAACGALPFSLEQGVDLTIDWLHCK
jgi:nucleoside-diphosphate-sugar epimerase